MYNILLSGTIVVAMCTLNLTRRPIRLYCYSVQQTDDQYSLCWRNMNESKLKSNECTDDSNTVKLKTTISVLGTVTPNISYILYIKN